MILAGRATICTGGRDPQGAITKRDSRSGRYMTTGRSSAGKSAAGSVFECVHSKGGEILVTNTKRASDAFRKGEGQTGRLVAGPLTLSASEKALDMLKGSASGKTIGDSERTVASSGEKKRA